MDQHNPSFSYLRDSNSFSFDNPHPEIPQRTISKCLRLKTNESLDGRASIEAKKQSYKYINLQESQIDNEHCLRLAQQEYDLRTQSLIKQYELRLNKQEEYYGLTEWKLKQELENLEKQNALLAEELRRIKASPKQTQEKCSLCGDGQILSHYNRLLSDSEQHHKGCLNQKKELTRKSDEACSKYKALQIQNQKLCLDVRSLSKQLRVSHSKIKAIQNQRDTALESLTSIESMWKKKTSKLEYQSKQLERDLAQRDMELNQSKATVESTQSVLTNPQFSLKSSILKSHNPRQDKQNIYHKPRASLSKATVIGDEDHTNQGRALRKLTQNIPRNGTSMKYEPLRMKYF